MSSAIRCFTGPAIRTAFQSANATSSLFASTSHLFKKRHTWKTLGFAYSRIRSSGFGQRQVPWRWPSSAGNLSHVITPSVYEGQRVVATPSFDP
jgi:hypothetical protein